MWLLGGGGGPSALASPPAATVPAVTVNRSCYVNTATAAAEISITGRGWSAGTLVGIRDRLGRVSASATAGDSGTFSVRVPAPVVNAITRPERDLVVAAAELMSTGTGGTPSGPEVASPPFRVTNFAASAPRLDSRPARTVLLRVSGFLPGRRVEAHLLDARDRPIASADLGRAAGACGLLGVRRRELLGAPAVAGDYTLAIDSSRRYTARTRPQFRIGFRVPASAISDVAGTREPVRAPAAGS